MMKNSIAEMQKRILMMMLFTSITVFSQGTTTAGYYKPKSLNIDVKDAKSNLTQILSKTLCSYKGWFWNSHYPSKVEVFEDKFELTLKKENIIFYFTQLLKYDISVSVYSYEPGMIARDFYLIQLDSINFYSRKSEVANLQDLTDYLYFFQKQQKNVELKEYEAQLSFFEMDASKYRALPVKPTISEEQRKLIVQANLYNEKKDFKKAIELYLKVTVIDPISYAAAYSNLALISALMKDYQNAIFYMKKYLMLEPNAIDSRASQDKIYEWEAQMEQ